MNDEDLVTLIVWHETRHPAGGDLHAILDDLNLETERLARYKPSAGHDQGCGLSMPLCHAIAGTIVLELHERTLPDREFLVRVAHDFTGHFIYDTIGLSNAARLWEQLQQGARGV